MRTAPLFFFLLLTVILKNAEGVMPNDVRSRFTISTNQIRSNLALGKIKNRNNTRLPTGRNIYQLVYSTDLEAKAEKWLSSCSYTYPNIPNVAANAIKLAGLQATNGTTAATIVKSWFIPLSKYGLQSVRLTARDNSTLRSFVRMTWHNSREIGCAIKQCNGLKATLGVCLYSPAQVKVGAFIYAKAPHCKVNGDCTTYSGSTCNANTGLCYSKPPTPSTTGKPTTTSRSPSTTNRNTGTSGSPFAIRALSDSSSSTLSTRTSATSQKPTTTSAASTKPTSTSTRLTSTTQTSSTSTSTRPTSTVRSSSTTTTARPTSTTTRPTSTTTKPSTSTLKPTTSSNRPTSSSAVQTTTGGSSTAMTDTRRLVALNAHNTLRSAVANGNAVNKNGTNLPSAKNIYQLSYSKLVESYAVTKANSCQWNHTYVNGTSNNLYVFISTGGYASPDTALNQSVYSWYQELKDDGQSSLTLDSSNYNHFTEVVWAGVKEIGCAVANCPTMAGLNYQANYKYTFVVCDYSPSGNIMGQKIYEPGTPCSACPTGSTCNSANKLCAISGVSQIHD